MASVIISDNGKCSNSELNIISNSLKGIYSTSQDGVELSSYLCCPTSFIMVLKIYTEVYLAAALKKAGLRM